MVRAAAVQFEPTLFRKSENTAALLRLAGEAAVEVGQGGLVVLPEMATTGYVFRGREEIAPYVEPIPGPTTRVFGRLARERGVTVVLGMPEVDAATGAYYNSAAVVGPAGEVAGLYRKTHSFHCDTLWAAEGNLGLPVFRGPWPGPLGLLICMDAGFFETARVLAVGGARVLAFPTNWLRAAPSPEWRARAAENGAYLVAADRWGEERGTRFAGGSCVIGPRGQILARRDRGDGVVAADLELAEATSGEVAAPFGGLVRRRPELYHDLLRHSNLWPHHRVYPHLGEGRFWLAASGGDGGELPAPREPLAALSGRVYVLPPICRGDRVRNRGLRTAGAGAVLEAAVRDGVYLAAAVGPREEVVLAGPSGLVGRYTSPHLRAEGAGPGSVSAGPSGARFASAGAGPGSAGAGPGSASAAGPRLLDHASPFRVFDLPFARVGLLHALDLLVPEATRILAKLGADVVLASGSWPEDLDDLRFLWAERAEPNDIFLALATDRGGGVFRGGERAAGAGAGEGLTVETGPGTYTRRKDVVRRLRPDLYLPLVAAGAQGALRADDSLVERKPGEVD